jgi:hypothetical protein
MSEIDDRSEIAIAAEKCFADDGTLDLGELNVLLALALRDSRIDEEEKRVLGDVLSRVSEANVTPVVWARIQEIEKMHNI